MAKTITLCKFVGTVSLGLLTGVSYTLATLTLPTLLALPTATLAARAHAELRALGALHTRALAAVAASAFTLAFALAPAPARHPYLLWTTGMAGLGVGLDLVAPARFFGGAGVAGKDGEGVDGVVDLEEEEARLLEGGVDVNGEVVRRKVEGARVLEGWRFALLGSAFAMSVVGIWGDRF